jgi:GNAT superfamily N-acetyltransferase
VFAPPLARRLTWPWVPHVTLADGIDEDRVEAAAKVLDRFEHVWSVDRVVMLQERPGRTWVPVADVGLGAVAIVGTGGLPLEISQGRIADPEVRRMLSSAEVDWPEGDGGDSPRTGSSFYPIVMSARREGELVGMAAAWTRVDGAHVGVFVAPEPRRQGIGTHLLGHLETAARRAGWPYPALRAEGPAGFYEARSGWARTAATRIRPRSTAPAS